MLSTPVTGGAFRDVEIPAVLQTPWGRDIPPLTSANADFSTIHSPYNYYYHF